ncbi:phosphopantothenoylcysteine decarboxylase [Gammaproteobacteria bacterium SCGC AG-212-F23]|nr:phosphopantothenoylcysteine decarboxylase [Gammaproteobacteria bacterium SCGC AG-212-F23]
MAMLKNKQIVLGVTGGIAAYKSADLTRRLREAGANVRVVMTQSAKEFITPLTMQAVSGNAVHDDLFDLKAEAAMGHIELARWADVIVIAPASADCIARIAHGEANDLLTTICLASKAPIVFAPAMNQAMWKHTATQENLQALQQKGFHIVGPAEGSQACGDVGPGRMLEPLEIIEHVAAFFKKDLLAGKHILITAGPTREYVDPVRYFSNASSGKMGYALAEAARDAGASVTLISGPVALAKPDRVTSIDVVSAKDMYDAVMQEIAACDVFMSAAAVSDYTCDNVATHKIKKTDDILNLQLRRTPDIVASVAALAKRPFIIGFAAETENLSEFAKTKLQQKKTNMIFANLVGRDQGIGTDDNTITVFSDDEEKTFGPLSKARLARELILYIAKKGI